MTRRMADSVTPTDIPVNDPTTGRPWALIAGYIDGLPRWPDSAWGRFPNSVHVRIALNPATNDGHVLDVENGAANPDQAPDWVRRRRAAGQDPTVYCNRSLWPTVINQFNAQGVAQPHYWIAAYPGSGGVQESGYGLTSVAHQFSDTPGGHWDESVVIDYWPGVDGNAMALTADDINALLDAPIARAGSETGPTSLRQMIAWGDSNTVLTRTTVNGHTDTVLSNVVNAINTYIDQRLANAQAPNIDYDMLATKIAAKLHIQITGA